MIPAIICFFACLLTGALVARSYEKRCKALRYGRDLQEELTEKWFNKYCDEALLRAQESVRFDRLEHEAAAKHEEQLKDAVELERYLKDEERDEASESIESAREGMRTYLAYYCDLYDACTAKNATIKGIRSKISRGEL